MTYGIVTTNTKPKASKPKASKPKVSKPKTTPSKKTHKELKMSTDPPRTPPRNTVAAMRMATDESSKHAVKYHLDEVCPERHGCWTVGTLSNEIVENPETGLKETVSCAFWLMEVAERDALEDNLFSAVLSRSEDSVVCQHPGISTLMANDMKAVAKAVVDNVPEADAMGIQLLKLGTKLGTVNQTRKLMFTEISFNSKLSTKYFNEDSIKGELEQHLIPVEYDYTVEEENSTTKKTVKGTTYFVLFRAHILGTEEGLETPVKTKAKMSNAQKVARFKSSKNKN